MMSQGGLVVVDQVIFGRPGGGDVYSLFYGQNGVAWGKKRSQPCWHDLSRQSQRQVSHDPENP